MRFQPTLTFKQYRDTCQAVATAKTRGSQGRSWKGYVSLGIACLALGLSLQVPAAREPAFTLFAVLFFCWFFLKLLAKKSKEKCFRRIFLEEQEALNNQVLTIDELGITCVVGHGQITSHHSWEAFTKCIDMFDAYVFLPSPNTFVRVPKEPLSLSEMELILRWSSAIPKTPHGT